MTDCTVEELKQRIDDGKAPVLIDVRETEEVALCAIPGAVHVPMGDIPSRLMELEEHAEEEVVVYCHHGVRSANVQAFLKNHGFENVRNLVGGIDAWSLRADPSTPRY
ncbi:MAG: sulfurtransferase [Candidatus Sumerlaeia bacterium]|nr:sulfurtransferase [Candidatus Sumerlaeia bacterium]